MQWIIMYQNTYETCDYDYSVRGVVIKESKNRKRQSVNIFCFLWDVSALNYIFSLALYNEQM